MYEGWCEGGWYEGGVRVVLVSTCSGETVLHAGGYIHEEGDGRVVGRWKGGATNRHPISMGEYQACMGEYQACMGSTKHVWGSTMHPIRVRAKRAPSPRA